MVDESKSSPLSTPLVSGADGHVFPSGDMLGASYWDLNVPASLTDSIRAMTELGVAVAIEVGPASYFSASGGDSGLDSAPPDAQQGPTAVLSTLAPASSAYGEPGPESAFVSSVARAYEAGLNIDFAGLFSDEVRRRESLPGYPFQRRRHWVDWPKAGSVE